MLGPFPIGGARLPACPVRPPGSPLRDRRLARSDQRSPVLECLRDLTPESSIGEPKGLPHDVATSESGDSDGDAPAPFRDGGGRLGTPDPPARERGAPTISGRSSFFEEGAQRASTSAGDVPVPPEAGDIGMTRYYVTAAIDYPNARPHVGHSFEKVAADVVARYHRLRGDDVRFAMGLDENSQHVAAAARRAGRSPRDWIDDLDAAFRLAWTRLNLSNDAWIRTSSPAHHRAARRLFTLARDRGDVYRGKYAGWYCPNCNNYYAEEDLADGLCPEHRLRPEWVEEENFFFALSRYSEPLRRLVEGDPGFIQPGAWRGEMLALLRGGLRDFSVTRAVRPGAAPWGVPVPDEPDQVLYVWFDALTNYLTALGFPDDTETVARYWPADAHVVGKNITRFHCLYWPAMLLSAGLPVPRSVAVHGFMTLEGQRISKTTGNVVDPVDLVDEFGCDTVRYYLLREFGFVADGDFSRAKLIHRRNSDLGNDLGNLLNRTATMAHRYLGGTLPPPVVAEPVDADLAGVASAVGPAVEAALGNWDTPSALESIWSLVRRANVYAEETAPWRLAKAPESSERLAVVLANLAEALRITALFLAPFLPETADRILERLGLSGAMSGDLVSACWGAIPEERRLMTGPVLFPRVESGPLV